MPLTFNHWLNQFCFWLDQTAISQTIQTKAWIVPTVQTVHILAIAAVMTSALMIDLRLIGVVNRDQPFARVCERFLPFVWWPLLVLLVTGVIMIVGEPARSLKNPVFQLKVALIIVAVVVTLVVQASLRRQPTFGDLANAGRGAPLAIAILSILVWAGIVCAGRWIAYF
jgi:hypothetical protein